MPLSPGSRLGPYEIVSAIGAGGMGEVYRVRDTRLGREVAIKVLPASSRSARLEGTRLEIGEARYVSWAGTKLKPHVGKPALVLLIDAMP